MGVPTLDSLSYPNTLRSANAADRGQTGPNRELLRAIADLRVEMTGRLDSLERRLQWKVELMESQLKSKLELFELRQHYELRLIRSMVGILGFILIALLAFTVPLGPIR